MLADERTMSAHVVETTCELSAFMKGGVMAAGSERDAGFCSGGDEDDNMSGLHSPSASEDSVEVQVTPISLRNKRKLAEPRKIQEPSTAPLKKRRFEHVERAAAITATPSAMDSASQDEESRPAGSPSPSPFRPWSSPAKNGVNNNNTTTNNNNNNNNNNDDDEAKGTPGRVTEQQDDSQEGSVASLKRSDEILRRHDETRWLEEESKRREEESRRRYEARIQQEVLTRLQESDLRHQQQQQQQQQLQQQQQHRPMSPVSPQLLLPSSSSSSSVHSVQSQRRESRQRFEPPPPPPASLVLPHPRLQEEPLSLVLRGESPRVPAHPAVSGSYERPQALSGGSYSGDVHSSPHRQDEQSHRSSDHPRHHQSTQQQQQQQQQQQLQQQRNYKNMTRERRIEANARERTRVHTISAAFDTLRRAIPAYSHNQKLSKLSVLRIACSYIMTLSNIANTPEGEPTTSESLGACVDLVSRTIQTEGKLRKKKDE